MDSRLLLFFGIAVCVFPRIEGQTPTLLTTNINRTGCGNTKLCLGICDPSNSSSCFFASSRLQSNSTTTLFFELSGTTSGFVGLGLSQTSSIAPSTIFACGNSNVLNITNLGTSNSTNNATSNATSNSTSNSTNNSTSNAASSNFLFVVASNSSSGYVISNTNSVYSVQGAITGNQTLNQSLIQCTFNTSTTLTASNVTSSTKGSNSYYAFIVYGTTSLNSFVIGFNSSRLLDLTSPTGNSTANSTSNPSTSGSNPLVNPVAHALVILLSALGLVVLY